MSAKEAEINKKKVGEESLVTIKLTIKNLIIVLGFLASMVTGAYFALKSDISGVKDEVNTSKQELKKDIDRIKEEDLKIIYNQVNQIDGKVQVLVNGNRNFEQPPTRNTAPDTTRTLPNL